MSNQTAATGVALAIWAGLIVAGFVAWERYDATPGAAGAEPAERPPSGFKHEVVMFLHPHCPCSRASLTELEEAILAAGPDVGVRVVFVRPPGDGEGWERGELWDRAAELPRVRVRCDPGGAEAKRAGATTSGHVVVYDAAGTVLFRGGITRARGREGDNPGRRAVEVLLDGGEPESRETPVFGCPLFDSDEPDQPGETDPG